MQAVYPSRSFARPGLFTDHGPIVAVNGNASNPHYEPTAEVSSPIQRGDFVLLDMWAKLEQPDSIYYDITWTGYCGDRPTGEMRARFRNRAGRAGPGGETYPGGRRARRGVARLPSGRRRAQSYSGQGFGEYFVHRTGHSIGQEVHGNGANMDNLETHDERRVEPWTGFSVEPGIYLPEFGVRSEVNVFVGDRDARVTGEMQRSLVIL